MKMNKFINSKKINCSMKCISCGRELDRKGTYFKCPVCNEIIARCEKCRRSATPYKCKCGFEGP